MRNHHCDGDCCGHNGYHELIYELEFDSFSESKIYNSFALGFSYGGVGMPLVGGIGDLVEHLDNAAFRKFLENLKS